MYFLPTAQQMKDSDRYTTEILGVPSLVLMERAALAIADRVNQYLNWTIGAPGTEPKVLCVCGTGNNGGDGVACARILYEQGIDASAALIGDPGKYTPELEKQVNIAANWGVPILRNTEWIKEAIQNADVLVDAIFGIGLARDITGEYEEIINEMNDALGYTIAADIPSGIDADTGKIHGVCVYADETVTIQYRKMGLLLYPGAGAAGEIIQAPVGIHRTIPSKTDAYTLTEKDMYEIIPERDPFGNKGTFGKVLIAAGSPGVSGASYLASCAALRSGCGMVKIIAPEENRNILQTMLPEAMLAVYRTPEEAAEAVRDNAPWANVIACGPGIGTGETGMALTKAALEQKKKTVILDADALNCLVGRADALDYHPNVIITPHMGEMSRLCRKSVEELKEDPVGEASAFSKRHRCICVLKDARTCIGLPGGGIFINTTGSSGMATAGSGDVLTGILAGLMAQGCVPETGTAAACFLHGMCGELAEEKLGPSFMKADDIIAELKEVLR